MARSGKRGPLVLIVVVLSIAAAAWLFVPRDAERSAVVHPRERAPAPAASMSDRSSVVERLVEPVRGAGSALEILVFGPSRERIEGATVNRLGLLGEEVLGRTDHEGRLHVGSVDWRDDLLLRAEHPRFASTLRAVSAPIAASISIEMDAGHVLHGRVLRSDGAVPGTPLTVLVWPAEEAPPSVNEVVGGRESPLERPAMTRVRTAADGSFVVAGLSRNRRYCAIAGGEGLACHHVIDVIAGMTDVLEIPVRQLHAAILRLVSPTGEMIPVPRGVSLRRGVPPNRPQAGLFANRRSSVGRDTTIVGSGSAIALAAPDLPYASADRLEVEMLLLLSDRFGAHIGPNRLRYDVPGHEPKIVSVDAAPASSALTALGVPLTPVTNCFGTLRVRFLDQEGESADPLTRPDGTVLLRDRQGGKLTAHVRPRWEDGLDIEGIPCGEYSASFSASHHAFAVPPRGAPERVIHVGGDVTTFDVVIPEGLGALDVVIELAGGVEWAGSTQLEICRETPRPNARGFLEARGCVGSSFSSAPYVLTGLPTGTYWLRSSRPLMQLDEMIPVEVVAGQTRRVLLHSKKH